jgi:hypothetical protein
VIFASGSRNVSNCLHHVYQTEVTPFELGSQAPQHVHGSCSGNLSSSAVGGFPPVSNYNSRHACRATDHRYVCCVSALEAGSKQILRYVSSLKDRQSQLVRRSRNTGWATSRLTPVIYLFID